MEQSSTKGLGQASKPRQIILLCVCQRLKWGPDGAQNSLEKITMYWDSPVESLLVTKTLEDESDNTSTFPHLCFGTEVAGSRQLQISDGSTFTEIS